MAAPIRVLGIVGSLRKGSFNRIVFQAAQELAPRGMTIEECDLSPIPLYNGDLDTPDDLPGAVLDFKQRIAAADALLIVTPEYNYSIPGVLKNALDWASRTTGFERSPLNGKPLAIMSAAGGMFGGVRAQLHLRQVCVFTDLRPLNKPEVLIPQVQNKVQDGRLTDESTRAIMRQQLDALAAWTQQLQK